MVAMPAPSLPTKRVVMNKTLLLLGSAARISNPDDPLDSDAAELSMLWDIARRATIVLHPWNMALTRAKLLREAGDPSEIGPAYSFKLPTAWLRWLPWDRDSEFWFDAVEEGGFLLSDRAEPLIVRGLTDVPDVDRWPPLFTDVMAYTMAIERCHGKTQALGLRDRLVNERAERLDEAYRVDGLASANRPRPSVRQSRWAGARFNPVGQR